MKIAFLGNPNSGKTTLFNGITGKIEHVGNWAGVTVDKKEGKIKKRFNNTKNEIVAVDLPGAYSMSPFTSEEKITKEFVENEKPDIIINVVDATNLSRSLFLTTQLLELGIPVVVALNKSDMSRKKGIVFDIEALSEKLNCPIVETVSTSNKNNSFEKLINEAVNLKGKKQVGPFLNLKIDSIDEKSAKEADKKRFEYVNEIIEKVEKRSINTNKQTRQDAVDRILAHKWLGIPIFALVMWEFSLYRRHI